MNSKRSKIVALLVVHALGLCCCRAPCSGGCGLAKYSDNANPNGLLHHHKLSHRLYDVENMGVGAGGLKDII